VNTHDAVGNSHNATPAGGVESRRRVLVLGAGAALAQTIATEAQTRHVSFSLAHTNNGFEDGPSSSSGLGAGGGTGSTRCGNTTVTMELEEGVDVTFMDHAVPCKTDSGETSTPADPGKVFTWAIENECFDMILSDTLPKTHAKVSLCENRKKPVLVFFGSGSLGPGERKEAITLGMHEVLEVNDLTHEHLKVSDEESYAYKPRLYHLSKSETPF
jgi:hypothetical protein